VRVRAFPLRFSASALGFDLHQHPPPPNNSFKPTPCRGVGHVLCATLARVRRPATGRLNSSVRRQTNLMQLFYFLGGAMLTAVGTSMLIRSWRTLNQHRLSLEWPTVTGTMVRSILHEETDSEGTSYRADLEFEYSVSNKVLRSTQHTGGKLFANAEECARQIVKDFPVGKSIVVHVDPRKPISGVLNTGQPHHMIVLRRIGAAALAGGLALILYGLFLA
jgi:hypothetical protein